MEPRGEGEGMLGIPELFHDLPLCFLWLLQKCLAINIVRRPPRSWSIGTAPIAKEGPSKSPPLNPTPS